MEPDALCSSAVLELSTRLPINGVLSRVQLLSVLLLTCAIPVTHTDACTVTNQVWQEAPTLLP